MYLDAASLEATGSLASCRDIAGGSGRILSQSHSSLLVYLASCGCEIGLLEVMVLPVALSQIFPRFPGWPPIVFDFEQCWHVPLVEHSFRLRMAMNCAPSVWGAGHLREALSDPCMYCGI